MAAPAAQRPRQPHVPSPEQILDGYERALVYAEEYQTGCPAIDVWCWNVVTKTIERLGPERAPLHLRIARYRRLVGSLHGFRIGTVTASSRCAASPKGRARAEREMFVCIEDSYDKWLAVLISVAESTTGFVS